MLFRGLGIYIVYILTALVISLSVHEASHAWAALQLGDDTPYKQGRVSLNPLRHLDPIGSLMILFVGVGWGKPVQVDATKLRPNAKIGMALVAIAGPTSNLILATLGALVLRTHFLTYTPQKVFSFGAQSLLLSPALFVDTFVVLNLGLMLFNMIPLAPLDGSRLWQILLPDKLYWRYAKYEVFAAMVVVGLVLIDLYLNQGQFLSRLLTTPLCNMWRLLVGFGTPDMCLQLP